MPQIIFITFSAFLIYSTCTNAVPQDAPVILSKGVAGIAPQASPVIGPQSRVFPCPEAADIAPCVCTVDVNSSLNMDCSAITSNEDLNTVFLSDFPVPTFKDFMIGNNTYFTELQSNCFGNVTFQRIIILDTNINYVSPNALENSAGTLNYIYIRGGSLTDSTFPFNSIFQYTNLDSLYINTQAQLNWVPAMTSNILTNLGLYYSPIDSFAPGN